MGWKCRDGVRMMLAVEVEGWWEGREGEKGVLVLVLIVVVGTKERREGV